MSGLSNTLHEMQAAQTGERPRVMPTVEYVIVVAVMALAGSLLWWKIALWLRPL